ncbi:DUF6404 family protein [Stenotrophomonas sp. AB1(2024)]|uniref:DUF6404 family protein n=1 Tax=Stenotrophomonas sp. AB1(2024) TaxID=3132215 RepID=UPI0030A69753
MTNEEAPVEAFSSKIARMRKDLAVRGVSQTLAAPPAWRIAWRLGWNWTPPLFRSFRVNVLTFGSVWVVLWQIVVACLPILSAPHAGAAVGAVVIGGAFFGLVMACVVHVQRKRLRLPPWSEY